MEDEDEDSRKNKPLSKKSSVKKDNKNVAVLQMQKNKLEIKVTSKKVNRTVVTAAVAKIKPVQRAKKDAKTGDAVCKVLAEGPVVSAGAPFVSNKTIMVVSTAADKAVNKEKRGLDENSEEATANIAKSIRLERDI